jgi:hypothetical protein
MDDRSDHHLLEIAPRYIHDTIDGETVVMDTIGGRLTLLTGCGPAVWTRFARATSHAAVAAEAAEHYGPAAADDIARFVGRLVEDGLLVPTTADTDGDAATNHHADARTEPWPSSYEPPQLEHHDDVADILTMDPIHDVDTSRGWPTSG